ncbi:MAG TPA: response regulator transcription factor, partial [Puia sp.]|nr:response regulator transcription factor [Puia sp.]
NHVPIIMLTAKAEISDRVTGLDAGADDYLVKPFSFEELLARIRALLRRPPDGGTNQLRARDLVLDTATKSVTRSGSPIRLSYKEFHLLEYLLRNKNRVLSRNAIINHVWEYESDILPSTVEVFIVYLRAKIDKPFQTKLIKTVRGFGYMLEDLP